MANTQYRFRPAKNTANAMRLIRRIQDYAETTDNPLFLILLDWEKAFDVVNHACLCTGLEIFGRHGYDQATFFVKYPFGQSNNIQEGGKGAHDQHICSSL